MGGNGCACSCQNASPDVGWPVSTEAPPGIDAMSWSSRCVWDLVSFDQGVLKVSAPVEVRNPNNVFLFFVVIISQTTGNPQLSIQFSGTNDLGGTWSLISGPTNITTLGGQFLGPVSGIAYRWIRVEMQSTSQTATAGGGYFHISHG